MLSHPNATLAPQTRQARAIGENLNYVTLAPQARQARPSGEILNYSLSHYSDILSMIIEAFRLSPEQDATNYLGPEPGSPHY